MIHTFEICTMRRTQHPSQTFLLKELLMTAGLQEKHARKVQQAQKDEDAGAAMLMCPAHLRRSSMMLQVSHTDR